MLSTAQNSPLPPLAANLLQVRERMAQAAALAGRNPDALTLIAVSKGQSVEHMDAAAQLGLRDFGENYVTEALPKIAQLASRGLCWHFIGRIQANKTRIIASSFDWVHSVDRSDIARRLSSQRGHFLPPLNLCLQVNVLGEASKGGVTPEELPVLIDAVLGLPRIRLRGLMGMLPYDASPALQAEGFGRLRQLLEVAQARGVALDTLSMGMSADLETAIVQGATHLRIGTALFGERSAGLPATPVE